MSETQYCSQASPDLDQAGTADPVDLWLMLEYNPSWKAKVLQDNALSDPMTAWLDDTVTRLSEAGYKVRPQFIRQPEFDRSGIRCYLSGINFCRQFDGPSYDYLLELDMLAVAKEPAAFGEAVVEAQYFVCMNGQRDICCARFGRPVYAALMEHVGQRAWQVSHLGGHRFAPNVLSLPQGAVYGRVDAERIGDFVSTVDSGELAFEALRGTSWYSKAVQAAEVFAGEQGLCLHSEEPLDDKVKVTFAKQTPEGEVFVAVELKQADQPVMALASCKDDSPKAVYPFERVS